MTTLSVVIPAYNEEDGIATIVSRVLAVEPQLAEVGVDRLECIVVDDGSTDGSPDILAAFPDVHVFRNPSKGTNSARRFGQRQTTAPLLTFLDQDDLWHPDHLLLLTTVLAEDPGASAAISKTQRFDDGEPPAEVDRLQSGLMTDRSDRARLHDTTRVAGRYFVASASATPGSSLRHAGTAGRGRDANRRKGGTC